MQLDSGRLLSLFGWEQPVPFYSARFLARHTTFFKRLDLFLCLFLLLRSTSLCTVTAMFGPTACRGKGGPEDSQADRSRQELAGSGGSRGGLQYFWRCSPSGEAGMASREEPAPCRSPLGP